MPELPEVETVRRGLAAVWPGRRFVAVAVRRPALRRPLPADFAARLTGRQVGAVERRAKYLLVRLDDGQVLLVHLGMSGRMVAGAEPPQTPGPHDHVAFTGDDGVTVTFTDPRRFGLMDLCPAADLARHPLLAALGPEPLAPAFDGPALAAALKGSRSPVKVALMDQRRVAGLGNIYACEALFRAGLDPARPAGAVTAAESVRLAAAIKAVLTEAIAAGGSSLRDHVRPSGEIGQFQTRFAVYGREGAPCPDCDCDAGGKGAVRRSLMGGRSTFYCAARQR